MLLNIIITLRARESTNYCHVMAVLSDVECCMWGVGAIPGFPAAVHMMLTAHIYLAHIL